MVSPDYVNRDGVAHWEEDSIPTSSKAVMLSTGLKDINGIEIFEKDIVRYVSGGTVLYRKIVWKAGGFSLLKGNRSKTKHFIWGAKVYALKMEVMGNMYEDEPIILEWQSE